MCGKHSVLEGMVLPGLCDCADKQGTQDVALHDSQDTVCIVVNPVCRLLVFFVVSGTAQAAPAGFITRYSMLCFSSMAFSGHISWQQ
jgi:hypothetical protein